MPIGEEMDGIATWYDATGAGNCSYDATPFDLDVVALNNTLYAQSAACGQCLEVEGPQGTVRVRTVDRCPGCGPNHIDLSKQAFAKVAPLGDGRVQVKWRAITCDVSGPLRYHFKDGSSQWWTAIQVRNHRLPVTQLEVQQGGRWVDVPRQLYNYFVLARGTGPGNVRVRVTAADGQQLEDDLGEARSNAEVTGAAQFD